MLTTEEEKWLRRIQRALAHVEDLVGAYTTGEIGMSGNCPICELRNEAEQLQAKKEAQRKALGKCWINGGLVNDTDETTIITIDTKIGQKAKSELLDLLKRIES